MDFGLLPPEINSGRMYAGPGSGPMFAAAAAWGGLAEQLYSAAASYGSVIAGLAAGWWGPSSATMAAAAAPYTAWISATAAQAEQTATQARAAAAAYETAFVATVPPPVIAANRALLMSLIATNFFGQNTPAISATEVHYAEMWAQDAAAMYGYAGSAATASQMTPFSPPPRTTNPTGSAGQAGAVAEAAGEAAGAHAQAMTATHQALHGLGSPTTAALQAAVPSTDPSSPLSTLDAIDSFLTGPFSPGELFKLPAVAELLGGQAYLLPRAAANLLGALDKMSSLPAAAGGELLASGLAPEAHVVGSVGVSGLSVSVGRAELIGGLSVPQGWTSAAPAIRTAAAVVPQASSAAAAVAAQSGPAGTAAAAFAADGQGILPANMAVSSLAGQAMAGSGGGGGAVQPAGLGSLGGAAAGESATADASTVSNIFVIPDDTPENPQ